MQDTVFNIQTAHDFKEAALKVFRHQFKNNSIYRSFCDLLYIHPSDVKKVEEIPFLPIQFFKSHQILSSKEPILETFTSSGTTGSVTSKHLVTDIGLYEKSYQKGFQHFYGDIEEYVVLALLPNYLERKGSSLAYMVDDLIRKTKNKESGFYLNNL
ncbi:MAG: acyl transferase, partial [Flavobacteriaceae bacterium]|nr:acyl transferase [Flavobacteriaceae bacterium]